MEPIEAELVADDSTAAPGSRGRITVGEAADAPKRSFDPGLTSEIRLNVGEEE